MAATLPPVSFCHNQLSDRDVRRGLRINIFAGSLGIIWFTVIMNFPLTMLLDSVGASGLLIGMVGMGIQLAIIVQIPATLFAERLAERKRIWGIITIAQRPLAIIPALLPFLLASRSALIPWVIFAVVVLSMAMMHSVSPLWFSWMADLVPEKIRGRFWSVRQSFLMAANLVSVALAGWILDLFPDPGSADGSYLGFLILFSIAAVAGTIDIIIHLWVPEPKMPAPTAVQPVQQRILAPLLDSDFRWLSLAFAAWAFSLALAGQYGSLYLKRFYDVQYSHLSYLSISASLGGIVACALWGYVMDRTGARAFGVLMIVFGPLFCGAWFLLETDLPQWLQVIVDMTALPQPVLILIVSSLFAGALYTGVPLAQLTIATALAPRQGRSMAMAVHFTLVGLAGALGSLAGGFLVDAFPPGGTMWVMVTGTRFGFMHVLIGLHAGIAWMVAIPMLLKVKVRSGDLPVSMALSRLMVLNPLKAMRNIYAMNAAVTPRERAAAVRQVGAGRAAIALSDLIAKLNDASADVREEAVMALGRIGSAEAVDALIVKLNDPHCDLNPIIARALREANDPRSVEALVDHLTEPDRESQSEMARTLGALGDRRAVASLMDVLRATDDDKVASASSAALARLGEVAAIYEILPRIKATRNPVLKRSLAVAVADLLGEPDRFYKVLAREQANRGVEVSRILKDLRKRVLSATKTIMQSSGEHLVNCIAELENAYESNNIQQCADRLFDLAIGIAALRHGVNVGIDSKVLIEDLIWKDEHFGIGVWYLNMLREQWSVPGFDQRDDIDVLLGIYFFHSCKVKEVLSAATTDDVRPAHS